jgi:hypothetical protein
MPELTVIIKVLQLNLHDVSGLDRFTRLEGSFDNATGLEIADLDPVERLTLAGLDKLVFNDGAWITIDHDFQTALEFIGAVRCHLACINPGY